MKLHHPFSPSKLERLELCPGSHALSEDAPLVATAAAEQGTWLHSAISPDAALEGTEEEKEMILRCRAFQATLREKHPELGPWWYEQPVKLLDGFEVLSEGTADMAACADDYVVVVDWKFGFKEVTGAVANLQVRTYAAALMAACKMPKAYLYIFHARTGRFTWDMLDMGAYSTVVERVITTRERCERAQLILNPSEAACEYCPAKAYCPALKRKAGELAKLHSSMLSDPEAMGKLLTFAKMVRKWVDSVEYHAKALAMRTGSLPGYHLRARKGNRSINDAQKAYDLVAHLFTPQEFMATCSIEVGALEEAYTKKRRAADPKLTLAKAKSDFETLMLPVIERAAETQTLVAA